MTQLEILQYEITTLKSMINGLRIALASFISLRGFWGHLSEKEEITIALYQKQIDEAQHLINVKLRVITAIQELDDLSE